MRINRDHRSILCAAALGLLAACAPSFDDKLSCVDDHNCPTNYHCVPCANCTADAPGRCQAGNVPPRLAFTAPAAGAALSGQVQVSINADHPDGVAQVKAKAGSIDLGTFNAPDPKSFGKDAPQAVPFTLDTTRFPDGALELSATATNSLGDTGGEVKRTVTIDNTAPAGTELTVTPNPANAGAVVTIHFKASEALATTSATVAGNAATSIAAVGNSYGFTYTVKGTEPAGSVPVQVSFADAAGNHGQLSGTLTLVFGAPAAPTFTGTAPASPAHNVSPLVLGQAAAQSTVKLYANATCTGTPLATGTAAQFQSPGLQVTVADNTTTTLHATATDAAGNVSACSPTSLNYTADSLAPAAPVFTGTSPASPSNSLAPSVKGTAEAGSTVKLFSGAGCAAGTLLASGTAAVFAGAGIQVTAPANTVFAISATATDAAGNVSPCAAPLSYVSDQTPPSTPAFTSTAPASPSQTVTNPRLLGTVTVASGEASPLVQIFTDAACTAGNLAASGTVAQFASPGLQVTVQPNTKTTFYARAVDPAGNLSACSSGPGGSIVYEHDNLAPAAPALSATSPSAFGMTTGPLLKGTSDASTTVKIYLDPSCTGALAGSGSDATFASPGIATTVPPGVSSSFFLTATDAAGNVSACTGQGPTFLSELPTVTQTVPVSPSQNQTPAVLGSVDSGAAVTLFSDASCTVPLGSGTEAQFSSGGIVLGSQLPLDGSTNIYAVATLPGLAPSGCSASFLTYVTDHTPPAAATFSGLSPASPAMTAGPKITGSAEANSTVTLFADACINAMATGTAAQFASPGITLLLPGGISTISAIVTDQAGNSSGCATGPSFNSTRPTVSSVSPASPNKSTTPSVLGNADATATVTLYKNSSCTGASAGSGSASAFTTGIAVSPALGANSSTTFFAQATLPGLPPSACSTTSVTYVADNTGPAAVTGVTVSPSGAAMTTSPILKGTAEAGSTVNVFTAAGCTAGTQVGTLSAAAFASPGFTATLTAGATTNFFFAATDVAGNVGACTAAAVAFSSTLPTVSSTSPASPNKATTLKVLGTADSGSTVQLYTDASCTTATGASGTAATFASTGLTPATVGLNSSTTYYAKATLTGFAASGCSTTSVTYVADNTAPSNPIFSSASPASPAMTTAPRMLGTSDAGSTVNIYTANNCTIGLVGTGSAAGFASPGIPVTLPGNAATSLFVQAVDQALNTSACVTLTNYASSVPTVNAATSPASPNKSTTPKVLGTADSGSSVTLYTNSSCTGTAEGTGTAAIFSSTGITVSPAVGANGTTTFYAQATLTGLAPSGCSATFASYTADNTAPAVPTLSSLAPSASAMTTGPILKGAAEAGSTVNLYTASNCLSGLIGTGSAAAYASPGITATVPSNAVTIIYGTVTDVAGNVSGCQNLATFTSTVPTVSSTSPASPSKIAAPKVLGTADANSTVTLYSNSTCTSAVLGSGTAANYANPGLAAAVTANAATTIYATATLTGFAPSGCSVSTVSFTNDQLETTPSITSATEVSGGVVLKGSSANVQPAGSPSTIYIYANDATCNGKVFPTGSVGSGTQANFTGAAGITVSVFPNVTTAYYALSTDGAGNVSACSPVFNFTESSCAAGVTTTQAFSGLMKGCAGTSTWVNRAAVCSANSHVCSANEWTQLNGGTAPAHHYWTDDDLHYTSGVGYCGASGCNNNNCLTTLFAGTGTFSCGTNSPFKVCLPSATNPSTDPEGNTCNWSNCGFNSILPKQNFGGCGSTTAGVLCCSNNSQRFYVDAVNGSNANNGSSGAPLKTISAALAIAGSGDSVNVRPGVYNAALGETFPMTVPGGVFLIGDEATQGGAGPTRIVGNLTLGSGATLAGFTMQASSGIVVTLSGSGATVRNNTISGNTNVFALSVGAPNQTILFNVLNNNDHGILYSSGSTQSGKVENNTMIGNNYEIEFDSPGGDLGGGSAGSVGNNIFSCSPNADVWVTNGVSINASNNVWDHSPPTFSSSAYLGTGVDLYSSVPANQTSANSGARLTASPCP